jgi:hypothetical protein
MTLTAPPPMRYSPPPAVMSFREGVPMAARRPWLMLMLLVLLGSQTGCVVRQMTIRSEPPGAMVVVNRREVGVTPVVVPSDLFVYHGDYEIFLIKDGFEPLLIKQPVPAPWYELFPFDFFSENLIPWRINDRHEFVYQLTPKRNVAPEQVLEQGNSMRQRGQGIGPLTQPPAPPPPDAP